MSRSYLLYHGEEFKALYLIPESHLTPVRLGVWHAAKQGNQESKARLRWWAGIDEEGEDWNDPDRAMWEHLFVIHDHLAGHSIVDVVDATE